MFALTHMLTLRIWYYERNIATAKAVRTLGVEHTQWHLVDNQTGRVACEFD